MPAWRETPGNLGFPDPRDLSAKTTNSRMPIPPDGFLHQNQIKESEVTVMCETCGCGKK